MTRKRPAKMAVETALEEDEDLAPPPDATAAAPQPTQMSVRERVKLAHALATVVEDPEVLRILRGKPYGDLVVSIFVEAVESRLNALTGGTATEESQKASEVLETLEQAETVIIRLLQGVQRTVQGNTKPLQSPPQRATPKIPAYEDEFERPGSVSGKPDYYVAEEGEFA